MSRIVAAIGALVLIQVFAWFETTVAGSPELKSDLFDPGPLKPIDSQTKLREGQPAPDFTLRATDGRQIALSAYRGHSNVVLSFIPAAWTPVCSDQWPGYNLAAGLFKEYNAVLIGIATDNVPTLWAWTREMGKLWFPVVSDFWPHGQVAERYGVLRGDGMAERALVFIDIHGVVAHIHVSDINVRPKLELIREQLKRMQAGS